LNGFLVLLIAVWLARDVWQVRQPNPQPTGVASMTEELVTTDRAGFGVRMVGI